MAWLPARASSHSASLFPRVVDTTLSAVPMSLLAGRMFLTDDPHYKAVGLASWYGDDFHGRRTANGEIFDMNSISAASPVLPLPSYVRVTNLENKRSLIVRVNDRGPYHGNRLIDVSGRAAHLLDFRGNGIARVKVEYVGKRRCRAPTTVSSSLPYVRMAVPRRPLRSSVWPQPVRSFRPSASIRSIPKIAPGNARRRLRCRRHAPIGLARRMPRRKIRQSLSRDLRYRPQATEMLRFIGRQPEPFQRPGASRARLCFGFRAGSYDGTAALTSGRGLY